MITTESLSYPILMFSKRLFILEFKESPHALIWEKASLRRLDDLKGVSVIDNELKEYHVLTTRVVRGHGFLSGYFLRGPFLERRVVFSSELAFVLQRNIRSVAELIIQYMQTAQGFNKRDVGRFWAAFETFAPSSDSTIAALYAFYSDFKWGDELG